jgi:hypothetical protein
MVGQNEQNLGTSLGNLSSSIYGGNYQAERARQDAAGQALGALTQQNYGLQGSLLNQAGSQYLGGLNQAANNYASAGNLQQGNLTAMQNALSGLQSGYQAGNNNQMQALALFPSLLNAQYSPSQAMVQAGQGLTGLDQQQIQDQMNRFYGNISAPWQTNQAYLNQIGQPTTGSAQTQQPYYQNQLANILGAGVGGLGLFNGAKSALGGTGSLFGGGSVAPWALDASGASVPLDTAALAGSSAIDFGGGEAASALPAAAMAWIICTELVKQGRLPRRWWAVGAKTFAAYPEIAKRGYYVWAIPSVRHLRRKPNSVYSRVLCKVFNWRAEDIAARAGVKGARKLWRGRAVTAALALPCLALGAVAKTQDWRSIYRNEGLI